MSAFTDEQIVTIRKLSEGVLPKDDRDKLEFYFLLGTAYNPAMQLAATLGVKQVLRKLQTHYREVVAREAEAQTPPATGV